MSFDLKTARQAKEIDVGGMKFDAPTKAFDLSKATPVDMNAKTIQDRSLTLAGDPLNIDLSTIQSIESSGRADAFNKRSQARGLHQITPIVVKEWNNFNPDNKLSDEDMFDPKKNTEVADWYMNKRIPQMLKAYKLDDTTENRLWAYNAGIGHVRKGEKPQETVDYIKKFDDLTAKAKKEYQEKSNIAVEDFGSISATPEGEYLPPKSDDEMKRLKGRSIVEMSYREQDEDVPDNIKFQWWLEDHQDTTEKALEVGLFSIGSPIYAGVKLTYDVVKNLAISKSKGEKVTPKSAIRDRSIKEFEPVQKLAKNKNFTKSVQNGLKAALRLGLGDYDSPLQDFMDKQIDKVTGEMVIGAAETAVDIVIPALLTGVFTSTVREGFRKAIDKETVEAVQADLKSKFDPLLTAKGYGEVEKAQFYDKLIAAAQRTGQWNTDYVKAMRKKSVGKYWSKYFKKVFRDQAGKLGLPDPKDVPKEALKLAGKASKDLAAKATAAELAKEALKFDTAEEFVKTQPTVFHGSDVSIDKFDIGKVTKWKKFGHFFTVQKEFAKTFGEKITEVVVDIKTPKIITSNQWNDIREDHATDPDWFANWKKELKTQGFDGLKVEGSMEKLGRFDVENPEILVAFEDTQVQTKAELTDIFNKAKEKALTLEVKKTPIKKVKVPTEKALEAQRMKDRADFEVAQQKLVDEISFGKLSVQQKIKAESKLNKLRDDYNKKLQAQKEISKAKLEELKAKQKKTESELKAKSDVEIASQKLADEINFGKKDAIAKRAQLESKNKAKVKGSIKKLASNIEKGQAKALPDGYKQRIDALLEHYDLKKRTEKTKIKREKRASYLEGLEDLVDMSVLPKNFFKGLGKNTLDDMTLGELEQLEAQIQALVHAGTVKGKLLKGKQLREEAEIAQGVVDTIGNKTGYEPEKLVEGEILVADRDKAKLFDRTRKNASEFAAAVRKTEFVTDNLGISEHVTDPVMVSADKARKLKWEFEKKMKEVFNPVKKEVPKWTKKTKLEGVRTELTTEQMIGVTLNSGNVDNIRRLLEGNNFKPEEIKLIRDHIFSNPVHKKLVEDIWKVLEDMRPYIAETFKNTTGITFKGVDGRYFPIMYDLNLNDLLKLNQDIATMHATLIHSSSVKFGSTKERGNTAGALNLNFLEPLYFHIQKGLQYSAYADNIKYVNDILKNKSIKNAIIGSMNTETYNAMTTWLKRVANPMIVKEAQLGGFVNSMRYAVTLFYLGVNEAVSAVQALSIFDTIDEIGLIDTFRGIASFYGNTLVGRNIPGEIFEKSTFMKERYLQGGFDRELTDMLKSGKLDGFMKSKLKMSKDALIQLFYIGITTVDFLTTIPSWWGAYEKELRNLGDEESARLAADKAVRKSQPTGGIENLATMMSGDAWQKLWTAFMSYTSTHYNRIADIGFNLFKNKELSASKNMRDSAVSFFWLVVPSSIMFTMIKNKMRPEDKQKDLDRDDFFIGMVSNITAGLPFLRDIMSGVTYNITGISPSAFAPLVEVQKLIMEKNKLKSMVYLMGLITKLYPKKIADLFLNNYDNEVERPDIKKIKERAKGKQAGQKRIKEIRKRYKK